MNSDTKQDFDALVSQAQIAHRLMVGFYQRLLPSIDQVAKQLELSFWKWKPFVTNRPCTGNKNPAESWAWDMVPMMASNHTYWRTNGNTSEVGDAVMNLYITFDHNFSNEDWKQLGIEDGQEPDATQMPIGQAIVEIYLSRCDLRSDKPLKQLWEEAGDTDENKDLIGRWQSISPNINATYVKKTLAEFISSPESTVAQLRNLLNQQATATDLNNFEQTTA